MFYSVEGARHVGTSLPFATHLSEVMFGWEILSRQDGLGTLCCRASWSLHCSQMQWRYVELGWLCQPSGSTCDLPGKFQCRCSHSIWRAGCFVPPISLGWMCYHLPTTENWVQRCEHESGKQNARCNQASQEKHSHKIQKHFWPLYLC